jgi:hypothetical protein
MLSPIPLGRRGSILITVLIMAQPRSWFYFALLLWLVCIEPSWSSNLSVSTFSSPIDVLQSQSKQKPVQKLLAQNPEQASLSDQARPQKDRYKDSRKQRSLSAEAIGTATLGSLSVAKALTDPHRRIWLFPFFSASAMLSGAFYYLQQGTQKRTHADLLSSSHASALKEYSERKSIQATAEIYWNKQLYRGQATEIGPQGIRVEIDDVIRELKILMPVGITISQNDGEPAKRFIVQVISIQPLATADNHRSALELRFPNCWQQRQEQKIKALLNSLP